jgi:hypothetical protein
MSEDAPIKPKNALAMLMLRKPEKKTTPSASNESATELAQENSSASNRAPKPADADEIGG